MSREWKPGDVAMVTCSDGKGRIALCGRRFVDDSLVWVFQDSMFHVDGYGADPTGVANSDAHPLVVIDPEDPEQVKRLQGAMGRCPQTGEAWCISADCCVERLTAALRSLIAPERPEEPTGLGAVVEDSDGRKWVRTDLDDPAWTQWDARLTRVSYSRLEPVRVLSEGVS